MANLNFIIDAQYKAGRALGKAKGDINDLNKAAANAGGRAGGLGKLAGLLGGGLVIGATAAVAAVGSLAKVIVSSTQKAADLEAQMSGIAAVMGKTKEEVAPLRELILDLGIDPNLKVTATEAADAIEMLGRNGLTMSQIMEGAARNTVLMANATGADFGTAADIATDVMALFNIEAKDMSTAVNGITSVVNNSKFSIDDYRLALAQGGGVAATVGVSFDDFNTIIAGISPLFASGSDAGTSFKTMLQRLIPQSNDAADTMRNLGLFSGLTEKEFDKLTTKIDAQRLKIQELNPESKNYQERLAELTAELHTMENQLVAGNNAFFDQQGNMRSMEEISQVLSEAMAGLSDEQRNNALSTIFGSDAMRAAAGVAELGNGKFLQLKKTMGDTSAEEAAKTRVDNLRGSLDILSGIFETIQIRIGEKFIPVFRRMVDAFSAFLEQHSDRIVGAFDSIAEWMDTMVPKISTVGERVLGMVEKFAKFVSGTDREMSVFNAGWDNLKSLFTQGLQFIIDQLKANLPMFAAGLVSWAVELIAWVGRSVPKLIRALADMIVDAVEWIKGGGATELRSGIGEWVNVMLDWIKEEVSPRVEPEVRNLITEINKAVSASSDELKEGGKRIAEAVKGGFLEAITPDWWGGVISPFRQIIDTVKSIFGISSPSTVFYGIGSDVLNGFIDSINHRSGEIITHLASVAGTFVEGFKSGMGKWLFEGAAHDALQGVVDKVNNRTNEIRDHLAAVAGNFVEAFKSPFDYESLKGRGNDIMNGLKDGVEEKIGDVRTKIEDAARSIKNTFDDWFDFGSPSKVTTQMGKDIMAGLERGILSGSPNVVASLDLSMGQMMAGAQSVVNNDTVTNNNINVSLPSNVSRERQDGQISELMNTLSAVIT